MKNPKQNHTIESQLWKTLENEINAPNTYTRFKMALRTQLFQIYLLILLLITLLSYGIIRLFSLETVAYTFIIDFLF